MTSHFREVLNEFVLYLKDQGKLVDESDIDDFLEYKDNIELSKTYRKCVTPLRDDNELDVELF